MQPQHYGIVVIVQIQGSWQVCFGMKEQVKLISVKPSDIQAMVLMSLPMRWMMVPLISIIQIQLQHCGTVDILLIQDNQQDCFGMKELLREVLVKQSDIQAMVLMSLSTRWTMVQLTLIPQIQLQHYGIVVMLLIQELQQDCFGMKALIREILVKLSDIQPLLETSMDWQLLLMRWTMVPLISIILM